MDGDKTAQLGADIQKEKENRIQLIGNSSSTLGLVEVCAIESIYNTRSGSIMRIIFWSSINKNTCLKRPLKKVKQ